MGHGRMRQGRVEEWQGRKEKVEEREDEWIESIFGGSEKTVNNENLNSIS